MKFSELAIQLEKGSDRKFKFGKVNVNLDDRGRIIIVDRKFVVLQKNIFKAETFT